MGGMKRIEVEGLRYIGGGSMGGQLMMMDEGQNLRKEEVKRILRGVGEK